MSITTNLFANLGQLWSNGTLSGVVLGLVGCGLAGRFGLQAKALKRLYAQALRESYVIRRVVDSTSDGLVVQEMDGKIIWANPAYCKMMMREPGDIIGRNPMEFAFPKEDAFTPEQIAAFRYNPADPTEIGLNLRKNQRANGEVFWNQINISYRHAPDGTQHVVVSCRDVSEQVAREHELETVRTKLEFTVAHDDLTGIANRAAVTEFTNKALLRAAMNGRTVGMLRVDLDKFKDINDTYGHAAGDAALVHVATSLKNQLRSTDMVARFGGDEFVVVCPDMRQLDDLKRIASTLNRACARPFVWGKGTLKITASFGAALSEPGTTSAENLLTHSDFALYEVKRNGRGGVRAYDEALHHRYATRMYLREEFAQAVAEQNLSFYFQPTVSLIDGTIAGFETLVRWRHPKKGLMAPDQILPLADDLGLMAELDLAAMEAGIAMKARMNEAGFPNLRIGLNASAEGLLHPDYVTRLDRLVTDHGFSSNQVAVEVLETVMLEDEATAANHASVIADLHSRGFTTMLDDFGIGYAGLSHLAQLDLSGIKIDRSLASRVLDDRTSHRIVRTIIELCEDLDLRLIAEGVETAEVAACLRDMGCIIMQGYWLSKPLPEDEVLPWLANRIIQPLPYGPSATVEGEALPAVQKRNLAS